MNTGRDTTAPVTTDPATPSRQLCVLGCRDRSRTDVWPRPSRPRVDGLCTCRPCADRILSTLDEVLELAATLELVTAAGSAPRSGDGGRKRIKDEPVAPVPVSLAAVALTDVRSSRGTWVPDAPPSAPELVLDDDGRPFLPEQLQAAVDRDQRFLDQMIWRFGPDSGVARTAASWLSFAQARLRAANTTGPAAEPRSINPTDDDPSSVVGFLDRWTDRVRVGRGLTGTGQCRAIFPVPEQGGLLAFCDQPAEYRRLIRIGAGVRTTGLFAVCPAGHVTRPAGQGDQHAEHRGAVGHRVTTGTRHGLTIFSAIGLLRRHNEWICAQPWVRDYWAALRQLRADLGQAHGEQRPLPIGRCTASTGQLDETGQPVECRAPLFASGYSDTISCDRCGTSWDHRHWRLLGRAQGVLA